MRHLLAVAATCIVMPLAVQAQTITGTINGTVTDATGAALPNATVTARNVDTGVNTVAQTNGSGSYSLRFLQIGRYNVTVKANGFEAYTSPTFSLEVNQIVKLDAPLGASGTKETVTVEGNIAPILDTENATVQGTFTANTIKNLPINDRNFSSITEFLPGSVPTDPRDMTDLNAIERDTNQGGQTSINGNRNQTNNYLLDGVEINETINNVIGYNPSPDALENLTVITSNAPAEYGNVNGGDVIAITKSGTNQFHGSAFAFLKNANLNANSFGNNYQHIAKQPFTQTIFGGTLGGPIIRNKLFFFIDYEGTRYQTGGTQAVSVLPQAYRNGDFSSLLQTNGYGQLYHYVPGQGAVKYQNNQVPITNPAAQYLFAHPNLYPLPNQPSQGAFGQNNYVGAYKKTVRNDQGDVKIDYTLGSRDSIMGRYSQGEASDATPQTPLLITFPGVNDYPFKGIAINEVHTFSSAIVNEFRAGWSRVRWTQGFPIDLTGAIGTGGNALLGIQAAQPYVGFAFQDFGASNAAWTAQNTQPTATGNILYPTSQNYFTGVGTTGGGSSLIDNTFTYGDNLTIQLSKHTLKAGVEVLRYQQNNFYPGNDGVMGREQYTGAYTGNQIADFLQGQVGFSGIAANVGRSGQRQYRDAAFVQDDWKPTQKLTVNLGVRYEYDQPIYEVNNKQANVDLVAAKYYLAGTAGAAAAFGDARAMYHPVYTNLMPRIGFAYQAMPRFVIRGGYGITNYLEGTGANLRLNFNPPFQPSYTYNASLATPLAQATTLPTATALPASFAASSSSNTLRAWDARLKPAFIQEFTLGTEYELNNKTSVMVAYLGQTGQHLIDARAANQLTLAQAKANYAVSPTYASTFAGAPYANLVTNTGSIVETQTESMMNYNAGQVTLRHRQSEGLEYQINYTYSKALTNNPGFFGTASGTTNGNNGSAYWQDAYNGAADYGPSGFDTRHNLSATGVYELPFGRGHKYGANMNWVADELVGGWKLTGAAILYSGLPITINGPNTTYTDNKASRANQVAKLVIANRSLNNWFGSNVTTAYQPSQSLQFGTASVGSERAPGYRTVDMTAGKAFRTYRDQNLEFRADFFNAFNIVSYGNPDAGITDTNLGRITDARSIPRQIQLSLHYNF